MSKRPNFNKFLAFFKKVSNKVSKQSIALKIGLAFTIIILLFGGSSLIVFIQASNLSSDIDDLTVKKNQEAAITELTNIFRSKNVEITNYILRDQRTALGSYDKYVKAFEKAAKEIETLIDNETIKTLYENLLYYNERMDLVFQSEIIPFMEDDDVDSAINSMSKTNKTTSNAVVSTEQMLRIMDQEYTEIMEQTMESQKQGIKLITVFLILSIVISIAVTIILNKNIRTSLANVTKAANRIAKGQLSREGDGVFDNNEIGRVQSSIDGMREQIRAVVQEIISVSKVVQSSSESLKVVSDVVKEDTNQMSSTMQELAAGSESQVSSTENLKLFMVELNEKVAATNEEGNVIDTITKDAVTLTDTGYGHMNQSVEQMERINESVHSAVVKVENLNTQTMQITKLITTIQEIASQTNLLSLNATIEAARAGEQGRGFAVVASEVGKLAKRVTQSSADITKIVGLIQTESGDVTETLKTSYHQVQDGTEQMRVTGSAFNDIRKTFSEMEQRINNIITDVTEISDNSKGLESAIETIASVSVQSAAGAEDTSLAIQQTHATMESLSSSAEELNEYSENLNKVIRQFET